MKADKFKMDSTLINPIIDKIYDIRDEYGYDDVHMLFACLITAETLARFNQISKQSKEDLRKKAEEIASKAIFHGVPRSLESDKS